MALANWDEFGMAENGELVRPCCGTEGASVHLYKNWLFVEDEQSWRRGGHRFAAPIVAKIDRGLVEYRDVTIEAWRGPQDGVFALAHSQTDLVLMVGVDAYDGKTGERVGVLSSSLVWFADMLDAQKEVEVVDPTRFVASLRRVAAEMARAK